MPMLFPRTHLRKKRQLTESPASPQSPVQASSGSTGELQGHLLRALSSPWFCSLWAAVGTGGSLPLGVAQAARC